MNHRKLLLLLPLIALLLATRPFAWAETAPLSPDALIGIDLDSGAQTCLITVPTEAVYDICAFPAEGFEGTVSARLSLDDAPLRETSGVLTLITESLSPGKTYALTLSGTGRIWLEISRHALSRCFDVPKALDPEGDTYAKAIVNPGDAHWYAITAVQSQPLMLTGLPEEKGLRLEARLFSDAGRLLAEATQTAGGAFLMDFRPRAGRTYRVRISAAEGGTGLYELGVSPVGGSLPEALILAENSVTLAGRTTHALQASAIPAGSAGAMLWESSDDSVVGVSQSGVLTGRRPGTAVVTAYAAGAVRARCRVEVRRVPATGVRLITRRIHANVGDDLSLEWTVLPENASDLRVRFEISPGTVATVDDAGVLRATDVGSATLTVSTIDGNYTDDGVIYIGPAQKRYRALLVGEQAYAPEVAEVRLGSANSVAGMRSMLGALSFLGARYEITTALDVSRDGVLNAIETAFDGASDGDDALFYITCHGYYAHGTTIFQLYDGSELTARELRAALDRVPGEITLMLDCCGSGGVMGEAGGLLDGVSQAFGPEIFSSSRYRVLASAMVGQDSYRLSFDSSAQETSMATLFARAVCEGCGWNIDAAQRRAMRADVNYDDIVTLDELYRYARRRVLWYLSLTGTGYVQTVLVSPEGDTRPLFERIVALE